MKMTDVFNAAAIAAYHDEVASNRIPYLGESLFPDRKKMGLDLKMIKTHKGLPVSLKPSAFDTNSTIRSREGFKILETQMAFFKESMLIKEEDEQEIMRIQESTDPYAASVLSRIFDDAETLISGAAVVPERMRMGLLCATSGNPGFTITADGATYAYNYDPNNEYKTNNYVALSGDSVWSNTTKATPIADIQAALDSVEEKTGSRPEYLIVSQKTAGYLRQNAEIKSAVLAQNPTANIFMTDAIVSNILRDLLGITIVVYNKKYIDDEGNVKQFFADGMATLIPGGALGNTWRGTTPDERTLLGRPGANTRIVDNGVAVTVTTSVDPDQTKTTVSEIVLPSFERMDETYQIKAY